MAYTKISKQDARHKTQAGHDVIIPQLENDAGGIVQVSCEEGHFEEIYMDDITFTYTVIAGAGAFFINDEMVTVAAGDTIVIPPGNRMYFLGKLTMALITTPAFDPSKEHHVRDIPHQEFVDFRKAWMPTIMGGPDYASLLRNMPSKRMSAAMLIFNERNEIVITNPPYKDGWQLPGGIIDENESPRTCVIREVQEELRIDVSDATMLHVAYVSNEQEQVEALHFFFDGGTLTDEELAKIDPDPAEVAEVTWVHPDQFDEYMEHADWVRDAYQAQANTKSVYTEKL